MKRLPTPLIVPLTVARSIGRLALAIVFFLLPVAPVYAQLSVDDIHFSPKGGCNDAIIKELGKATSNVRVQAYELTSVRIAKALADVSKRNVKVELILDSRQHNQVGNQLELFRAYPDISIKLDGNKHSRSHSKVIIIDGAVVITGSFNFTDNAENWNVENLLVIRSKAIAQKYLDQWQDRWEHHAVTLPQTKQR